MGHLETALAIWGEYDGAKASRFARSSKAYEEKRTKSPGNEQWEALSAQQWGPGLTDDESSIDALRDWRWEVASWPHERWVRWRRLATDLLEGLEEEPTAENIRAADRMAYDMIRAEVTP